MTPVNAPGTAEEAVTALETGNDERSVQMGANWEPMNVN